MTPLKVIVANLETNQRALNTNSVPTAIPALCFIPSAVKVQKFKAVLCREPSVTLV